MPDRVSPALCLDVLNIAAQNQTTDIRRVAETHLTAPCLLFDLLADLMSSEVLICSTTGDPRLLRLRFGPKAVQAVYLFALNFEIADLDVCARAAVERE